jgi:hypothetical protein
MLNIFSRNKITERLSLLCFGFIWHKANPIDRKNIWHNTMGKAVKAPLKNDTLNIQAGKTVKYP